MKNYYHLTKKELSFVSFIQEPVVDSLNSRVTRPVVVISWKSTGHVIRVYTLSWFKRQIKMGNVAPDLYTYEIFSMF